MRTILARMRLGLRLCFVRSVAQQESKTSPQHALGLHLKQCGFESTVKSTIKISGAVGPVIRSFMCGPDPEKHRAAVR